MKSFEELFGARFEVAAEAHGRVNLIGEHTDYNGGFVLPLILPHKTKTELRRRSDGQVRIFSEAKSEDGIRSYRLGQEKSGNGWLDYASGCTNALLKRQYVIGGFEARIESNVPAAAGIASSAALEISVLRALRNAFDLKIDDKTLALIGQSVENEFVEAHVGIMDQLVASLGQEKQALLIDTRTLDCRNIPLPPNLELIVLHSGIPHQIRQGAYNQRRKECEEAARLLHVEQLRDAGIRDLARVEQLPGALKQRARHVITENERVLQTVDAFKRKDLRSFGVYLNESHASLRDDYEVSIPEVDTLIQLAQSMSDVYGARMTGGGFGGSIVIAVKTGSAAMIAERLCVDYFSKTNRQARVLFAS